MSGDLTGGNVDPLVEHLRKMRLHFGFTQVRKAARDGVAEKYQPTRRSR